MTKSQKLKKRHRKIRKRIIGTAERPRLQVVRSLNHIYAQLIDDNKGETLATSSDTDIIDRKKKKTEKAFDVGQKIAVKAKEKKISEIVFDRRGHLYHGRVKALADGARKGGLKF